MTGDFLQAIIDAPEDDAPRLVYADWLEDNGQPERAEFIRVQIELEPHRFEIDRPRVRELLAREDDLLHLYREEWLGLAPSAGPDLYGPFCRRGVPEVVAVSLDVLLGHGHELLAAHPTLREVAVFDVQGRCDELARCPLLDRVATLEVADWLAEEDGRALLASPLFRRLPAVRLWYEEGVPWLPTPEEWPAGARAQVIEFGGASVGRPGRVSAELNDLSGRFAEQGKALVPVRPFLARFPLLPELRQNLHPGRAGDGRQVLFAHGREASDPVVFAFFDDAGNLVGARQGPGPGCCRYTEDYADWLAKEIGYRPCLAWMREFEAYQGLGIHLLPGAPTDFSSTGELWWWLYQGKYVINWCNTPWASRRSGEITDT
jgi:uncharacterized protein (TIGR02996 family)